MKQYWLTSLFFISAILSRAQLVNNGEIIHVQEGVYLQVDGDVMQNSGTFTLNGKMGVKGNIENNSAGGLFNLISSGELELNGKEQLLEGSKIQIPSLRLLGEGEKRMETDVDIKGFLKLGDRIIYTGRNTLSVYHTDPNSISRTSGFISTDGGGVLRRSTDRKENYLFPIGSTRSNLSFENLNPPNVNSLYRPVSVLPLATENSVYSVGLENSNPTLNFSNAQLEGGLGRLSDLYFFRVGHAGGATAATIRFYQEKRVDRAATIVTLSPNYSKWEKHLTALNEGSFGDGFDKVLSFTLPSNANDLPLTFAEPLTLSSPFIFYNAFSPDGDGKNDTWQIQNIELYPENTLTIFNRWGDEVYKARNYSNTNAWDGSNLQPGTYFYVLSVNVSGNTNTYKGFITMVKKN